MTVSMAKSQRIFVEDCAVDRIFSLPRNLIDCILELMPVRDAARTCVLSSKWRYVWADHPTLVVDFCFWGDVQLNRLRNKTYMDFVNVVDSILLYRVGRIRKFVIDAAVVASVQHSSIDLWLSCLSRGSLRELNLSHSRNTYKVPSWMFSSSELTHLRISCCIMKTKDNVGCFSKIKCLALDSVTLDSWAFTTPLLTTLIVTNCRGIRGFNIDAPRLAVLILHMNDYLNLKPYLTCSGITKASFYSIKKIDHSEECESINLVKLASAWPIISILAMGGLCFEYLTTGSLPEIFRLNLRSFVLWGISLDSEVIASILCVLKNSPLLHTFEIGFTSASRLVDIVEPSIIDYKIEQLRTVKMDLFTGSSDQVRFAEILLHCAPLLGKILVREYCGYVPDNRVGILKKLLALQRAFPKGEIIYGPNIRFHSRSDSLKF